MTFAIQLAGVALVALCAVSLVRPAWRLPVLAFALLSIPGNVDDLMPQMTLDRHPIPFATAPAISAIDLLIWLAAVLTLRERPPVGYWRRWLIATAAVAALATVSAAIAVLNGVEWLAALRGALLFWRVVALLYIAIGTDAHRTSMGLAAGVGLGTVVLLGNGVYTTIGEGLPRFTAATFGRNGLAAALVLAAVVLAGMCFDRWRATDGGRWASRAAIAAAAIAAAAILGAFATGTRIVVVLMAVGLAVAVVHARGRSARALLPSAALVGAAMVAIVLVSAVATESGLRTLSLLLGGGPTGGLIAPSGSMGDPPTETRLEFWSQALQMVADRPIWGVGPFQWNIERYAIAPDAPVVVADPHQAYLQLAAEFGPIVLLAYVLLLVSVQLRLHLSLWRHGARAPAPWAVVGLAAAAAVYPIADLTNSHLFNVRMGAFGWLLMLAALLSVRRLMGDARSDPPTGRDERNA